MTRPSWGFSFAASGMMIPPFVFSSSASLLITTLSCNGLTFMFHTPFSVLGTCTMLPWLHGTQDLPSPCVNLLVHPCFMELLLHEALGPIPAEGPQAVCGPLNSGTPQISMIKGIRDKETNATTVSTYSTIGFSISLIISV